MDEEDIIGLPIRDLLVNLHDELFPSVQASKASADILDRLWETLTEQQKRDLIAILVRELDRLQGTLGWVRIWWRANHHRFHDAPDQADPA